MTKSYNPFGMWGSYVGALVGFVYLIFGTIIGEITGFVDPLSSSLVEVLPKLFGFLSYPIIFIIYIFGGFLIGWGIHSLVRALRK